MKKIVIIADCHLDADEEIHQSYKVAKEFIKNEKPDVLVIAGDLLDFSYLSKYDESKAQLREGKRLKKDIEFAKRELDYFSKYSNELVFLEGNHENRLVRRIESQPEYDELISLDKLLDIKVIPETKQPVKIANSHLFVMHGKNYSVHFAAANLKQYMVNLVSGHTHRIQTFTMRGLDKELGAWGIGCLCSKNPYYLNGKMNQWQNGLGVAYIGDDRNFTMFNLHFIDNSFIWNGKKWG